MECIWHKSTTLISDNEGIYTSVKEIFIKPKIEDHGKKIKCSASIQDNENVTLYEAVTTSEPFLLDIKFSPQKSANQSLSVDKGDNVTITFTFKANPEPQTIKWAVIRINNETSQTLVQLTPGHDDDKYMVSNVTMGDNDLEYEASLTIYELDEQVSRGCT